MSVVARFLQFAKSSLFTRTYPRPKKPQTNTTTRTLTDVQRGSASHNCFIQGLWGADENKGPPKIDPQIVGFPYNHKDPKKVPLKTEALSMWVFMHLSLADSRFRVLGLKARNNGLETTQCAEELKSLRAYTT